MKARMHPGPAVKVAAVATAVLAVAYVAAVIVLNLVVGAHLTGQTEARLADRLTDVGRDPSQLTQPPSDPGARSDPDDDLDDDSAPVYLWAANASGTVTAHSPGAPSLPASLFRSTPLTGDGGRDGRALTLGLGPRDAQFLLKMARDGSGWLVAGQSLAGDAHTQNLLRNTEIIAGPLVLAAIFLDR